jgi:hypothetical protein
MGFSDLAWLIRFVNHFVRKKEQHAAMLVCASLSPGDAPQNSTGPGVPCACINLIATAPG